MFQTHRAICRAFFGLFMLCAAPALAQQINTASATLTCNAYILSVDASELSGENYQINFTINPSPSSGVAPITGSIPFNPGKADTFVGTVTGSFPALNGSFSFSGTATLAGSTTNIDFSPTNLSCGTPPLTGDMGCIYTLGTWGQDISLSGSSSLAAPSCRIFDNSASRDAATTSGTANVAAKSIDIVGGYNGSPHSYSPTPTTGAVPVIDPLADIPEPTVPGSCGANPNFSGSSAHFLSPGCYNGLSSSGSGNLTLGAGLYIINGSISFSGSGTVSGTGVTFYTNGSVHISGSKVMRVSAPTFGVYNGLLFFQSRSDSKAMNFSGSSGSEVQGIFYAPKAPMTYSGSSRGTFNIDLVVDSVAISGSANIQGYGSNQ